MKLNGAIAALAIGISAVLGTSAVAEDWAPDGTLTMQIGFGAGGSTDTMGRVLAKVMEEQTGWNIIAENKTGGGGVAMFTGISQRPPNGEVIGLGVNMPILINLVKRGDQLPFTVEDFDYLGTISKGELALVASADAPFDDVAGMIEHAKAEGTLAIAYGSGTQVALLDAVTRETGAEFNLVSTEGGAESMKLVLGGQVLLGFASGEHFPFLESGQMKVIASGNADRLSYAPDVSTFVENGINAFVDPWFYLATTKGTDPAAIKAIAAAIENAVATDEMKEIVDNAINTKPQNLGPDATKEMMVGMLPDIQSLFGN